MVKLPMSIPSQIAAATTREVLNELGIAFERDRVKKHYTRVYAIVPLPKFAYTFRFIVREPSTYILDFYDAKLTHSALIHFLEIESVDEENIQQVKRVLNRLVEKLPRKPWQFALTQKFQCGFLMPEIIKAKRKWKKLLLG